MQASSWRKVKWVVQPGPGVSRTCIMASPTVRTIGIEARPSHLDDYEARVWAWRGTTTGSAPPEALLDLLIRAVAARREQASSYFAGGGPAPCVRRHLQAAPTVDAVRPAWPRSPVGSDRAIVRT